MTRLRHFKPAGKAIFKDSHTTKMKELLQQWGPGMTSTFAIAGVPLSKPSISHSGASFAPDTIRSALQSYTTFAGDTGLEFTDNILDFGDIYMDPTDIIGNQQRAYEGLREVYASEAAKWWMVLGGDHSISYSSIKACSEQYGKVGVIQFDAHHDLRNVEDGGPTNGTPFRRLLEDHVIQGENLVQIGIRDFTNAKEYARFADEQGVMVYSMQDVDRNSMGRILEKEIDRLEKQVDILYLSVDIDVLDQAFAPGCPAIGPGGMDSKTLLEGIYFASRHEKVKLMDIVEIDPTIDFRNMTSRVAVYCMLNFMKAKKFS
ncbi:formimidoylglutamase [Virgibacillus dakarensis]|uniref:formimidoylglutamase n=1 Tax=Virgibacillus dakarensis TaxID=1917889 RepID=UPI000B4531E8|nr:formimidoylglutamase [Virgibacillus dakarensis]